MAQEAESFIGSIEKLDVWQAVLIKDKCNGYSS